MNKLFLAFSIILISACTGIDDFPDDRFSFGGGAFIINEGNFNAGNGSLSFYSYDSSKVFNDMFFKRNDRPLGDVPNSVVIYGGKIYIVVNNSGKIEVAGQNEIESIDLISNLKSPRNMIVLNDQKAYVTSLWSDSVTIVDLYQNTISGYINIGRSSEALVLAGNTAYVCSWANGNSVTAINIMTDQVITHIEVGVEPESMVIDSEFNLWVLCSGGWRNEYFPELVRINTFTNRVDKRFAFPAKEDTPSCLKIDGLGQNLFYIDKGVRKMAIHAAALPEAPLIVHDGWFYKLGVNPANGDILVTDAADYMQNGSLLIYKNDGSFVSKHTTGIIPGNITFNIVINNHQTE
jgi:YVTN family beta-propeller protein